MLQAEIAQYHLLTSISTYFLNYRLQNLEAFYKHIISISYFISIYIINCMFSKFVCQFWDTLLLPSPICEGFYKQYYKLNLERDIEYLDKKCSYSISYFEKKKQNVWLYTQAIYTVRLQLSNSDAADIVYGIFLEFVQDMWIVGVHFLF